MNEEQLALLVQALREALPGPAPAEALKQDAGEAPRPVPVPEPVLPEPGQPMSREDLRRMTAPEINANWELVKEALGRS